MRELRFVISHQRPESDAVKSRRSFLVSAYDYFHFAVVQKSKKPYSRPPKRSGLKSPAARPLQPIAS
jgi:hypothetical protein